MTGVAPWLQIRSRRGRLLAAGAGLLDAALALLLLAVATGTGRIDPSNPRSLLAGFILLGVATVGVLAFRRLR